MEASPPNLGDHEVDAYAPTTLRVVTFPENDMFVLEITFSNENHIDQSEHSWRSIFYPKYVVFQCDSVGNFMRKPT